ncbi:MAG: neutral/alkaline non-lysosomal ceramidase N-terminal domain-containing protein [Acetobacteraceae bacterium]|nr:neutral/alkaline non-lysosomal ceramidase N-terminal domain-containing protein [Acetobacteraceae bacterium]
MRGCGGQRSMPAWLRNPGARPGTDPADAIDPEMLVLRFDRHRRSATAKDGRVPIGMVSWFGLHPTNIGMFNVDLSGDNKGWASFVTERERGAHAFVAAFANAAAGDVSANLAGGIPLGGANNPADRDLSLLRRDIARMMEAGQRQADHARALFDGPMQEVRGEIALAHSFVDMSAVVLPSGQRTWPAMLGVSFGAGSSEDGFPRIVESVLPLGLGRLSLDSGIVEGIDARMFHIRIGMAGLHLATVLAGGTAAVALLNGLADPVLRSTVMALAGKVAFGLRLGDPRFRPADDARYSYHWEVPAFADPRTEAGQGDKPILFPVGEVRLRRTDRRSGAMDFIPCPMVPRVVPLQLVKIGQVVIAGVPGEFNAEAGLRLKERLRRAFGVAAQHYAVAGYANGYAGYVATEAEYAAQHYEGASTLYGPHTLEAYCHCFVRMAERMVDPTRPGLPPGSPDTPPTLHLRP